MKRRVAEHQVRTATTHIGITEVKGMTIVAWIIMVKENTVTGDNAHRVALRVHSK
jgi:hypothetical protein